MAHDFARERGGAFLLRIEDIDPGRARARFVDGIIEDLLWLGLEWDGEIVYQSERLQLYAAALERLKAAGLVYPCFCTRADIAASASAPHAGSGSAAGGPEGAIYPGTCRGMTSPDLTRLHAWRIDVAGAMASVDPLYWMDDHAEVQAEPERFGDVVLARKDAPASYHLAVTVDDAAQGVTDVVRGRDLYACTDIHRLLQALLDLPTPTYHHHALLADATGGRLAKRHGAPAIADLRAQGIDPDELVAGLREGRLPFGYSLGNA